MHGEKPTYRRRILANTKIVRTSMARTSRLRMAIVGTLLMTLPAVPAHAASKEIIQIQTQVQQLVEMVQRLQSTVDSHFGQMENLVQQSTANVAQMSTALNAMQQKLNAQTDATNGKMDTVSGQVQTMNDSIDELKTRLGKLETQLQTLQSEMQTVQAQTAPQQPAALPGMPPGTGDSGQPGAAAVPGTSGDAANGATPTNPPSNAAGPATAAGPAAGPAAGLAAGPPAAAATSQAPPLRDTYLGGLRDFNAAHYEAAQSEFGDVARYYPNDNLAGNAEYYLGEIAFRQHDYKATIKYDNAVLSNFSGNVKAPAAQLRKGQALIMMGEREAGIREYRALIHRYPQSPESVQARSRLNGMGVRINPR